MISATQPDLESIRGRKALLRAAIRPQLKRLSRDERAAASAAAAARLIQQPVWKDAGSILFYAALPEELDLSPLAEAARSEGRVVALPKFAEAENAYVAVPLTCPIAQLSRGKFGILEPPTGPLAPLNQLDLILVPGLAFDRCGRRLGKGLGFYDRLLRQVRGATCGVAFDLQIIEEAPVEPHDIRVDFVLTPTRWLAPRRNPIEP